MIFLHDQHIRNSKKIEPINLKIIIGSSGANRHDFVNTYDRGRNKRNPWLSRIAVSLFIIISVAFEVIKYCNISPQQQNISYDSVQNLIKKEVEKGQKLTIKFQEGTSVKLYPESSTSYPEKLRAYNPKVTIIGEAYCGNKDVQEQIIYPTNSLFYNTF